MTQTQLKDTALAELHKKIYGELEMENQTNPMSYMKFDNAKGRPYQTYERIAFEGLRWSVEKRVAEYGLERYLKPEAKVLDIGSNYGFFVCEFALKTKLAHGVDPVPELCNIGRHTAKFLGLEDKTEFYAQPFEDFIAPCKYDTIFSLASFFTSDKKQRTSAEAFFGKINDMLEEGGELFYESTSFQRNPGQEDYEHYVHALEALDVLKEMYDVYDTYETPSGPENFRLFARCKKK